MPRRLSHDSRTILVICVCIWTVTMLNLYTIGGRKNISTTISDGVHIDARTGDFDGNANSQLPISVNPLEKKPLLLRLKILEDKILQLQQLVADGSRVDSGLTKRDQSFIRPLGLRVQPSVLVHKSTVQLDAQTKKNIVLDANAKDTTAELERVHRELIKELATAPSRREAPDSQMDSSFCYLTPAEIKVFPICKSKILWMKDQWKSHACYASNGVDGSPCSARHYLSQVEHHCPAIPVHLNLTFIKKPGEEYLSFQNENLPKQESWDLQLDPLLQLLDGSKYTWMRARLSRMWASWTTSKTAFYKQIRRRPVTKKIFVYLGLLSRKSGFKFEETAFKGGPLGEMLQWSDILATLYCLGHRITVADELDKMHGIINGKYGDAPCPQIQVTKNLDEFDLILTDIVGLKHMKTHVDYKIYSALRCKLRIVDSFGTEPAFNHRVYAEKHSLAQEWGGHDLNPRQFYTMFPHTPDNSFMGFAMPVPPPVDMAEKKPQAVVYGKADFMWKDKEKFLETISRFVDIHATVFAEDGKTNLPSFITNHGILTTEKLHDLLKNSMFFIGLGFPYEGPAPLEAISFGCVFLNPMLNPPHDSLNSKFLLGKPTLRKLKSQHPYSDQFIGLPNVKTVDISDLNAVEIAVKESIVEIESGKVSPKLNREYTALGMLERLNAYAENQDFCETGKVWPPAESVTTLLSKAGQSCVEACWDRGLICEPAHFPDINSAVLLSKFQKCEKLTTDEGLIHPSFSGHDCRLQGQKLLYSCVGGEPGATRLCPCRDFMEGQVALCKNCR